MKSRHPKDRAGESAWSNEVRFVPLRQLSQQALARASFENRWGFSAPELIRIQRYFRRQNRDPTDVELAGIAQSWSEHCSYKSSRTILRAFARLRPDRRVLGTGDAGVMEFEDGYAYALRIESHNHPSAIEPYGGAATGIGGILRDVLAVGGKPVALADPLFFGPADALPANVPKGVKHPRYLMAGVIAGIRDYGNRVGVPTVSGGIYFDAAYTINPLVNVGCLGFLPKKQLIPNKARKAGDRLVLVGGQTGRDGLGGVAFASRELTEQSEGESRGAVQLGNPIMKEPLIRACLEAYQRGFVSGVKDLGGGGLATASGELVHAGGFGSGIDLDKVPAREPDLTPAEIWISESQERMLLDVPPANVDSVARIFQRFDVPCTIVGTVVAGDFERLYYHGELVAELEVGFRVSPPPVRRPRQTSTASLRPPVPASSDENVGALFDSLVLHPESRSRESVIRQYDHEVQGKTVVKPLHGRPGSCTHGDAAVLRPRPSSWKGLAVTCAANPWTVALDPKDGAAGLVEEAARNLYAVGARPDAFTNCLNFGNPEDPKVMGTFAEVVKGLARGARALGFAVPSGNVSFYNGGMGAGIPPTPVLMAVGIVDDVRRVVTSDFKKEGDPIYLVGNSSPLLGGSLYSRLKGLSPQQPPPSDPQGTRRAGESLVKAMKRGLVRSAHDISEGGLAVTLAEMAFGGELGFDVDLAAVGLGSAAAAVAAEGKSRWIVECDSDRGGEFVTLMAGTRTTKLGTTVSGPALLRWGPSTLASPDLADLYPRWRAGIGPV